MRQTALAIVIATLASSTAVAAEEPKQLLELTGDYTIPVLINGQPFKVAIDPDIGGSRVLSAASAAKLGLKGSMIGGRHMVGPVKLTANSNVLDYDFEGIRDKNRTFWFSGPETTLMADGLISASALPYKIVRFQLKAPGTGEQTYTLPLSGSSNNAILTVNGTEIAIGFNLQRPETLVTASTGLLLAEAYIGSFSGPAVATMIRYGVERPTRPMALAKAMDIGGLSLDQIMVRVSDFGDATQIKDADGPDGDEIIVTAASKKKPRHMMALGRAFLSHCSSLTFDYRQKQVQMSCAL